MNISSYNREFRTEGKYSSILNDVSKVEFIKLRELNLQNCGIIDLTPLISDIFKYLVFLNLQFNHIKDLTPMKNIKFLNIKEMHFAMNNIYEIYPLKNIGFKCLKVLGFDSNPINWNEENKNIYNQIISNN